MARRRQRRIHTFLQGSLCRQHYLVFPKTPALCKGKPVKVALGGSFSYIICNFGNLIYKQIFKYSQLTCIAIWKPHLEEDRCTRCRLGVSRKETAYKSSFQLRLFTQSEFRRNQVWDGDGLPWLLILMMVLAVCVSLGNFAWFNSKAIFSIHCWMPVPIQIVCLLLWISVWYNS